MSVHKPEERYKGVWVAFESDLTKDQATPILEAIRLLKGVLATTLSETKPADWFAREQSARDLRRDLRAILDRI